MRVIFGMTTNKHVKTAAELPENEENLKGLSFRWTPETYLEAWEINVSNGEAERVQLFFTEELNERIQKGVGEQVL